VISTSVLVFKSTNYSNGPEGSSNKLDSVSVKAACSILRISTWHNSDYTIRVMSRSEWSLEHTELSVDP
jgi:hypothetical protein